MARSVDYEREYYRCYAIAPGWHLACAQFIENEVEARHGGYYAGHRTAEYLGMMRLRGGVVLEAAGRICGFVPRPVRRGKESLLPFPLIEQESEHRGLQCLGQLTQIVGAMATTPSKGPPLRMFIQFPDERLPEASTVIMMGLCDAMPERTRLADRPLRGRRSTHRFDILPEMLPRVVASLLDRGDGPWIGAAFITTVGSAGTVRVHFPPEGSPLAARHLRFLTMIAAGKLSVIGLDDLPETKFGSD